MLNYGITKHDIWIMKAWWSRTNANLRHHKANDDIWIMTAWHLNIIPRYIADNNHSYANNVSLNKRY